MKKTAAKIKNTKADFFEKIKLINLQSNSSRKKRRIKSIILNMKKENLQLTLQKYKGSLRDYYKQLHANNMDNPEEINKFLERQNPPRLNHEETENINGLTTNNNIETTIKNPPTNKSLGPDGITGEFYQTFIRDQLAPILLKHFQKIAEGGILPNSFYEATIP